MILRYYSVEEAELEAAGCARARARALRSQSSPSGGIFIIFTRSSRIPPASLNRFTRETLCGRHSGTYLEVRGTASVTTSHTRYSQPCGGRGDVTCDRSSVINANEVRPCIGIADHHHTLCDANKINRSKIVRSHKPPRSFSPSETFSRIETSLENFIYL